jgi:hypothetical protein
MGLSSKKQQMPGDVRGGDKDTLLTENCRGAGVGSAAVSRLLRGGICSILEAAGGCCALLKIGARSLLVTWLKLGLPVGGLSPFLSWSWGAFSLLAAAFALLIGLALVEPFQPFDFLAASAGAFLAPRPVLSTFDVAEASS